MDFSKALDNVRHHRLVEKLKISPLCLPIVNWYISFLTDGKQRVISDGTVCEGKGGNKGTTLGSVSGPYLVSIFLNDLVPREAPSREVYNLVAREARVYHTSIARPG